jgi:hypothetical protein
MPVYVVSVGAVLAMRMVEFLVMVGFVVVMPRRHPSIVMMMDVWVISSPMAMVNRAHDSNRKLLLSAATAKRGRSTQRPAVRSLLALVRYVAYAHRGFIRLLHCWLACPGRESGCPGVCTL